MCTRLSCDRPMSRKTTFTLSEADLRQGVRLHVFSALRETRTIIRLSTLWVVATAALTAFNASSASWSGLLHGLPISALIVTAAIFGVAVGVPLALSPFAIHRRFQQDKLVRQPVSVSWDEEAYEAEQPGVHNRISWRDYAKWREDRHLFVFFMSDYNYQILPKHALTAEQIADLRRTLSAI